MKDENKTGEKVEMLRASLEEATPERLDDARAELIAADLDPGKTWYKMDGIVRDSIARRKREELVRSAAARLKSFFREILTPRYMQPAVVPVTRTTPTKDTVNEQTCDDPGLQFQEAVKLLRRRDFTGSRRILEALLAEHGESGVISKFRYTLAHALLGLEEFDAAIEVLRSISGEFEASASEIVEEIRSLT